MPRRFALLVLVAALAAGGCGFKDEPIGQLPRFPQDVSDGAGRTVVVDRSPARIASLDAGLTQAVFALGEGGRVVAATGDETAPAAAGRVPDVVTDSGRVLMGPLERRRPDLVLAPPGTTPERVAALERRLGADVYVASPHSIDGMLHDLFEVSLAVGVPGRGRRQVTALQARADAITEAVSTRPAPRVFVDRGFFYTIAPGGLADQLITAAGGKNAAPDADPGVPFGPRRLEEARPQVYLALAGSGTTLAGLSRSRATRRLPAVREKRFAIVPPRVLTDSGPRIVDSLDLLARAIHPDVPLDAP